MRSKYPQRDLDVSVPFDMWSSVPFRFQFFCHPGRLTLAVKRKMSSKGFTSNKPMFMTLFTKREAEMGKTSFFNQ